jgi:signal transduction histidine kinase
MGESSQSARSPYGLALGLGSVVFLISIFGHLLLRVRPDLPAPYDDRHPLTRAAVMAIDGFVVGAPSDIEFALRTKSVGRMVTMTVRSGDGPKAVIEGRLVPFFDPTTALVDLVIAVFSWGVAIAALLYRKKDRLVRIFFWVCVSFGLSVAVQGDTYVLGKSWATLIPGLGYILFTGLGPALLLHFFLLFPDRSRPRRLFVLYLPTVIAVTFFAGLLIYAFTKPSLEGFRLFDETYDVFRIYQIAYLAFAVACLARLRLRAQDDDVKAQARWVFWGLIVGMSPFLFLYQLPKILLGTAFVSENGTAVFFVVIPATLAIAIVKHRLFDVDVVINRSLVYSLLTISTAGIYLLVILVLQRIFAGERMVFSVIGVFAAAAAFHPAQRRIQDLIDRVFFHQRYDYRKALSVFGEQARRAFGREELLDLLLSSLRGIWFPDRIGIFILDDSAGRMSSSSTGRLVHRGDAFDESIFYHAPGEPGSFWARRRSIRSGYDVSFSRDEDLAENGLELAVPIAGPGSEAGGALALGGKRSGERYSREDLSFLRALAEELRPNMDRIRLQEEVIYERASREKSEELNRLKTEFISTVSHEMRTPMSSIQGLAELLHSGKIADPEQRERFISLMVLESGRLSRFLHNVLDFGKIEQSVKTYRFRSLAIQGLIGDTVEAFGPLLISQGAVVHVRAPINPVLLDGDEDALKQALMNLIDNAIKYAPVDKNVEIDVLERERDVEIRIADHGIGVGPEDQTMIFDRFYRADEAGMLNPSGAGLGLKIVKHIVEAHGGTIRLESEVGRGSIFRLIFPRPGTT